MGSHQLMLSYFWVRLMFVILFKYVDLFTCFYGRNGDIMIFGNLRDVFEDGPLANELETNRRLWTVALKFNGMLNMVQQMEE